MRRVRSVLLAAVLAVLGTGCPSAPPDYYPLEADRSWSYRMTIRQGDADNGRVVDTTSVVTNLPPRPFAGQPAVPQRQEAFGAGRVRLLRDDGQGVVDVGELNEADGTMTARDPVNPIVRRPLTPGASWSATWETTQSGGPTRLPMQKTVASTDDTVETAAGRFVHCLSLSIKGGGPVMIDGQAVQVEVAGEEWFAPGVGLVRADFRETVAQRPEAATHVQLDLIAHRP